MNTLKGKFITFEGVEGAGKSTQSKLLVEYLNKQGIEAIWTREPGGCELAEQIRQLLITGSINKWHPITQLLLMYAARKEHIEKTIKPHLQKGVVVVSDRFFDSSMAYQGYGYELNLEKLQLINNIVLENFKPDITFILDLDIKQGLQRVDARGEKNRFDNMKIEFHQKVREGFLKIAKENVDRIKLINVENKTIEEIHKEILKKIINN